MTLTLEPSRCLQPPEVYTRACQAAGLPGRYALIVLNQPILLERSLFENAWNNATYRYCADGGANRLYDLLQTDEERERFLPDCIRGDLDSLRSGVQDYYMSKHVRVERVDDQVSTDFMKCVELARTHDPKDGEAIGVVALGGTGGRFDQCMSSIHYLYALYKERPVTLISDESIIIALGPGVHNITCDLKIEGPTCGIIPVGASESILSTKGLKWDVEQWHTSFGTKISTSNALQGSHVVIDTTAPMVWTTELRRQS
ncbi:cAMP-dependent protein kinase subunit [Actinomortierella ambigua]|nr:cAMP-dependent protein kinase subunit [Actinomortierella ambigua]